MGLSPALSRQRRRLEGVQARVPARLCTAFEEDGVDFLWEVNERWGEPSRTPDQAPRAILDRLIASTPEDPGRWFATAKTLGFLGLAAELAERSPLDIGTLLRAARDHLTCDPSFAPQASVAALRWMAAGQFYEITAGNVCDARRYALESAAATGQSEAIEAFLDELITDAQADAFVGKQLAAPYGVRRPS